MKPAPFFDSRPLGGAAPCHLASAAVQPALDVLARLAGRQGCAVGAVAAVEGGQLCVLAAAGSPAASWPSGFVLCAADGFDSSPTVVADLRLDPRFAASALAASALVPALPPIRFFAAAGAVVDGVCIGCVCMMDTEPRTLDAAQGEALADLALLARPLLASRAADAIDPSPDGSLPAPSGIERIARGEGLYRSVAAAISDGLNVVGPECTILATNPAACDILGVGASAMVGRRLGSLGFELRFEDGRAVPDVDHPVRRVMQGGTSLAERVHSLHRADGSVRLVQLSVRPLGGLRDAPPEACLVTFRDITRQREAEQALRDRQAADIANRAKSEFLSRVSHEMRTPLNAVIGFTQLLRLSPDGSAPAQVLSYTDHVLRASEHLLSLINDLLDLQRVDEGRLALQPRALALGALIDATFDLLQPLARQHGVALQNRVGAEAWVRADAQRLRQVMINVVSNAIKYNRSGGWVSLEAMPGAGPQWVLAVEDSGSGLTQDQLARLFQPFERLGQESSDIEGSGLGLVIARRLVEAMDGELTLSSAPSSGTQVRIALPRAQSPTGATPATEPALLGDAEAAAEVAAERGTSPASEAEPASDAEPPSPALRMLYVEDNRINAILFEEAVRMRGNIELRVAEDGAEALAMAGEWPPQVLVLDANLPDMSGYEVLARLRELPSMTTVPAFMCSADAMEEDLARAMAAGFVGYWTKPIDVARVMRDLDRLAAPTA